MHMPRSLPLIGMVLFSKPSKAVTDRPHMHMPFLEWSALLGLCLCTGALPTVRTAASYRCPARYKLWQRKNAPVLAHWLFRCRSPCHSYVTDSLVLRMDDILGHQYSRQPSIVPRPQGAKAARPQGLNAQSSAYSPANLSRTSRRSTKKQLPIRTPPK